MSDLLLNDALAKKVFEKTEDLVQLTNEEIGYR